MLLQLLLETSVVVDAESVAAEFAEIAVEVGEAAVGIGVADFDEHRQHLLLLLLLHHRLLLRHYQQLHYHQKTLDLVMQIDLRHLHLCRANVELSRPFVVELIAPSVAAVVGPRIQMN